MSVLSRLPRLAVPTVTDLARPVAIRSSAARRPAHFTSWRLYSAHAAPPPMSGPKWTYRRVLITGIVSLFAFGSAGFGWQMIE